MEGKDASGVLASFLDSGIHRLDGARAVFVDPVRVLSQSYTRFRVSPSAYYSRTFESVGGGGGGSGGPPVSRKRKRRKKKRPHDLDERERSAEQRHQQARPFLLKAHEALLGAAGLLSFLPKMVRGPDVAHDDGRWGGEQDFIELGGVWQAPLYEMSLCFRTQNGATEWEGSCHAHSGGRTIVPLFDNLTSNETSEDVEAEFLNNRYILPRRSSFHMSDLRQIQNLIPAQPDYGFNLIVVDPPWENGSVYQKSVYPTLPNRYFLYLPVKQLAHTEGALVVLWMTNREKLQMFVEKELFPAWGVTDVAHLYWLKVKSNGTLISELDLFHHRPYECILVGYVNSKSTNSRCAPTFFKYLQNNQVIISIPGAHSRKPPLGTLLSDHIPGPRPARCLELFAREMVAGWTSWGNEPLRFQDSRYFVEDGVA